MLLAGLLREICDRSVWVNYLLTLLDTCLLNPLLIKYRTHTNHTIGATLDRIHLARIVIAGGNNVSRAASAAVPYAPGESVRQAGMVDMQMAEGERSSSVEAAAAMGPGSLVDMEEPECLRLADADPRGNAEVGSLEVVQDGYLDGIEEPTEGIAAVIFVLSDSAIENGCHCDV